MKRIKMVHQVLVITIFSLLAIPKVNAQQNCNDTINLDSMLLAYYLFDGNAEDESGNEYDGVVNGATLSDDRFGNPNAAYSFDGNDEITLPDAIEFDSAMSIAMWVKKMAENQVYGYIGKWTTSSGTNNSFLVYNGEGANLDKPQLVMQFTDESIFTSPIMPEELPINEWHHLCFTWSNSDGRFCAYLDGEKVIDQIKVNSIGKTINNDVVGYDLEIGNWGNQTSSGYSFIGMMDEVLLSSRVLNCNEVDSLYYKGCIQQSLVQNQVFEKDTTLFATELLRLENVSVNPPYKLTLRAPEILLESVFETLPTAQLNVINEKGCEWD